MPMYPEIITRPVDSSCDIKYKLIKMPAKGSTGTKGVRNSPLFVSFTLSHFVAIIYPRAAVVKHERTVRIQMPPPVLPNPIQTHSRNPDSNDPTTNANKDDLRRLGFSAGLFCRTNKMTLASVMVKVIKIPEDIKTQVTEKAAEVRSILDDENADAETINRVTDELSKVVQQIGAAAYQDGAPPPGAPPEGYAPPPEGQAGPSDDEDVVDGEFKDA